MAESKILVPDNENKCPVCLDHILHPLKLPCGHIFCYLCIKGAALKNRRCALCRRSIPEECIEKPPSIELCKVLDSGIYWYYEGRNGWWQYDQRTNSEIEEQYKAGNSQCEVLIAGCIYVIDFNEMLQYRVENVRKRRNIKREHVDNIELKGIAGIKLAQSNSNKTTSVQTVKDEDSTSPSSSSLAIDRSHSSPQLRSEGSDATLRQLESQFADSLTLNTHRNPNSAPASASQVLPAPVPTRTKIGGTNLTHGQNEDQSSLFLSPSAIPEPIEPHSNSHQRVDEFVGPVTIQREPMNFRHHSQRRRLAYPDGLFPWERSETNNSRFPPPDPRDSHIHTSSSSDYASYYSDERSTETTHSNTRSSASATTQSSTTSNSSDYDADSYSELSGESSASSTLSSNN